MSSQLSNPLFEGVKRLRDAGLSVLPIRADGSKAPAVSSWKAYEERRANDQELAAWFGNGFGYGVGIIGGEVSGGLEIIDHDAPALVEEWRALVEAEAPGLLARLPQVLTPKGGLHIFYRCAVVVGNQKLAQEEVGGKLHTLIETRGSGGYVVTAGSPAGCHPSGKLYEMSNGDLKAIPTISEQERDILLNSARALNRTHKSLKLQKFKGDKPGDEFNLHGDVRALLIRHGWRRLGSSSAGERWQRPGGEHNSATLFPTNYLYVFSSNADPFQPDEAYSPFAVYTLLEHGGDYSAAASRLHQEGYGQTGRIQSVPGAASVSVQIVPTWEAPAPFDQFPLPQFPVDALPLWLKHFVKELSHETQTPVEMAALFSLSTLAAVFAPQTRIRIRGNWKENLNLYTLVALPPANRKSAVHEAVKTPLVEAELEIKAAGRKEFENRKDEWDTYSKRREALRRMVAITPEGPGRDQKVFELQTVTDWIINHEEPHELQLYADDATPEELATLLKQQNGSIAVLSAEGGLFDQMAGRYSDGVPNLDVFLKGHNGDTMRINRRGRFETIDSPRLTIALAVQPDVLKQAATKPGFRKRGLLGRFLYAMPDSRLGNREIAPEPMSEDTFALYREEVKWFRTTAHYMPLIWLSDEADRLIQSFELEVEKELGEGGKLAEIPDWGGKLVGHVARLAGILHLAENVQPTGPELNSWVDVVSAETVGRAIQIGRCLCAHALAIFAEMGPYQEKIDTAMFVLRWLRKHDKRKFSRTEVRRGLHRRFKLVSELQPILDLLVGEKLIREMDADPRGHRPAQNYETHPDVFDPDSVKIFGSKLPAEPPGLLPSENSPKDNSDSELRRDATNATTSPKYIDMGVVEAFRAKSGSIGSIGSEDTDTARDRPQNDAVASSCQDGSLATEDDTMTF